MRGLDDEISSWNRLPEDGPPVSRSTQCLTPLLNSPLQAGRSAAASAQGSVSAEAERKALLAVVQSRANAVGWCEMRGRCLWGSRRPKWLKAGQALWLGPSISWNLGSKTRYYLTHIPCCWPDLNPCSSPGVSHLPPDPNISSAQFSSVAQSCLTLPPHELQGVGHVCP